MDRFYTPFYSNMMRENRYLHTLQFTHFTDNRNVVDRTFSKFYNPSENLPIDQETVLFKGRVIFRQYVPKKYKQFGIQI